MASSLRLDGKLHGLNAALVINGFDRRVSVGWFYKSQDESQAPDFWARGRSLRAKMGASGSRAEQLESLYRGLLKPQDKAETALIAALRE